MPITWDNDRRAWVFDDVTEVEPGHFNNLLQWGQPYTPYEPGFRHDLYDGDHTITSPTVIFSNQDVITHGFGQNIQLTDFDVVQNLQQNGANVPNGTYTLTQLQNMGLSAPGQFGDHAMGTNLYINQGGVGVSSQLGAGTAAYVFGSIRFQMSENTTFVIENGQLVSVDGSIELQPDNFNHESSTLPDWVSAIVAVGAGDTVNFDEVVILYEGEGADRTVSRIIPESEFCFGPEVPIDMWPLDPDLKPGPDGIYDQDEVRAKVWKKPIELIRVGDLVVSFDDDGNLVPGPVTRTFQNNTKILLNFHGTRVTPGHVYSRPDSKKSYKYETLIDVLRDDGVIQKQDGTPIRAATNVPVDSPRDGFVRAVAGKRKADGTFEQTDEGRIRLGTRFLVGTGKERKSWAVADLIKQNGGVVGQDELVHVGDGPGAPLLWDFSDTLPKPEDFVLACSGTTLEDIYKAAEWESQGPHLPAPMVLDRGPVQPLKGAALSAMPRNKTLNVAHAPMAAAKPQRTLNRKQRKAIEAKQRKAAKTRKRIAV